jgi:hypothetical protein
MGEVRAFCDAISCAFRASSAFNSRSFSHSLSLYRAYQMPPKHHKPENRQFDLAKAKLATDFHDGRRDVTRLCSGDSYYIADFIKSAKERAELFDQIMGEAQFTQMFNVSLTAAASSDSATQVPTASGSSPAEASAATSGTCTAAVGDSGAGRAKPIPRLVTAQAEHLESGASAIYRMPGCNEKNIPTTRWTPAVKRIVDAASEAIGQKFNHCVVSLYRDGSDGLGYHKDKTVDIADQSVILSVSLGATRPIQFAPVNVKHGKVKPVTVMLKAGSLLAIGPRTNSEWMHGIPKLTEDVGPRISLSIRSVASFIQWSDGKPTTDAKAVTPPTESKADTSADTKSTAVDVKSASPITAAASASFSTAQPVETERAFVITGKGAAHQTPNYPFSVSFDDSAMYSESLKTQMATASTASIGAVQAAVDSKGDALHGRLKPKPTPLHSKPKSKTKSKETTSQPSVALSAATSPVCPSPAQANS